MNHVDDVDKKGRKTNIEWKNRIRHTLNDVNVHDTRRGILVYYGA
jgi:hypothetical protein